MNPDFRDTTRSLGADRGPAKAVVGVVLALLAAWGGWMALGEITLTESSTRAAVQAEGVARLRTPAQGAVAEVAVALGDRVAEGDVLIRLDDTDAALALAAARAEVQGLREQLGRMEQTVEAQAAGTAAGDVARLAELGTAQANLSEARIRREEAEREVTRLEGLVAKGAASEGDLSRARTEASALSAREQAAAAEVARLSGRRTQEARTGEAEQARSAEERVMLEASLAVAEAELARRQEALEQKTLRAPVAGSVGELAEVVPGQLVSSGSLLAVIVPEAEPLVAARFTPERAVGRVQPGQPATVRVLGAAGGVLGARPAEVARVGSEPGEDGLVPVQLRLTGPTEGLEHGLPAEVEVAIEQVAPITLVLRASGRGGA